MCANDFQISTKKQNLAIKETKRASKILGSMKHLLCKLANSSISGTNGEAEGNSTNLCSDLHTCALAYTQHTHTQSSSS